MHEVVPHPPLIKDLSCRVGMYLFKVPFTFASSVEASTLAPRLVFGTVFGSGNWVLVSK